MLSEIARNAHTQGYTAPIMDAHKLPKQLYKSLTRDRGKELSTHRRFTLATDIRFASAIRRTHARGSNESNNGLLRQYRTEAAGTDSRAPKQVLQS